MDFEKKSSSHVIISLIENIQESIDDKQIVYGDL